MKIGLAAFGHETITFWPGVTDLAAFERVAYHGQDVIAKNRGRVLLVAVMVLSENK